MASTTNKLNPLLDLDIAVYRAGFAVKGDEPLSHCLQATRNLVEKMLRPFPEREYYKGFLTADDGSNFRHQVATILPYKGNRVAPRPDYYQEIREYLIDRWGAEVVHGREADDALGEWQWKHKDKSTCIVSIDKDLRLIPGYHYQFVQNKLDYVSLSAANRNFYQQLLTGDRIDNVPGIRGIGPKKADGILEPCGGDPVRMRRAVEQAYKKHYGANWQQVMDEVGRLLFIEREPGKTWSDYV